MLQNAPFKIFFGEACPLTPLANAWLRHASQASPPPPKKINSWPPLAIPAYAPGACPGIRKRGAQKI